MSEHTPGPWQVYESEDGGGYTIQNPLVDSDGGDAMYDPIVWEMGGIDTIENANLIAAAPDLLAACEAALEAAAAASAPIANQLRAAIAKARNA